MIIKTLMRAKLIGITFQCDNQYQRLGYQELIKGMHINDNILVIDSQALSKLSALFDRIYIITDYLNYSSQCICNNVNANKSYIIDESRNAITKLRKDHININAQRWAQGGASLKQPDCLYCRTLNDLSFSELDFISTLTSSLNEVSDIKEKVMSCLNIDRKGYSRILRKLLTRLELKNEHALFRWASNQTYQKLKEM